MRVVALYVTESLTLISLTTDSVPFQPAEFESADVAPESRLRLWVTYLPRSLGNTVGGGGLLHKLTTRSLGKRLGGWGGCDKLTTHSA